jgi:short-subunit dehydrogenase
MDKKSAIVVGATSGIGRELAKILVQNGYTVGAVGRRSDILSELQKENQGKFFTKKIDVSKTKEAMKLLQAMISEMGGVDLLVINSGVGHINSELLWPLERETIEVNVFGFAAMANIAMEHFLKKGSGHLVGISSVSALRGSYESPAYSASKAFLSNYLDGIRAKVTKLKCPIVITDIQPGFVDTAMAKGDGLFWVASPQKAAQQIYETITKKKKHVYVTKRWRIIGWLLKTLPDFIYYKL